MKVPVNLVSAAYYRDEIAYQEVIDSRDKANALTGKIHLSQDTGAVHLALPAEMKHRSLTGKLLFYCPANMQYDRQFELTADSALSQTISKKLLMPGSYVVKVSWQSDNSRYYSETPLTLY